MKKYIARLAEDGDKIGHLVDPGGEGFPEVKWDKLYPWWVVITDEDKIIGCCQMIVSLPIGHIEFLCLDEKLSVTQRAYAIKVLASYAIAQMHAQGVYVARSSIPHEMKQWKKVVKKRWGTPLFSGTTYAMRVH